MVYGLGLIRVTIYRFYGLRVGGIKLGFIRVRGDGVRNVIVLWVIWLNSYGCE